MELSEHALHVGLLVAESRLLFHRALIVEANAASRSVCPDDSEKTFFSDSIDSVDAGGTLKADFKQTRGFLRVQKCYFD